LAATDRFCHLLALVFVALVAVAERTLPEAAVARRHVEVAALGPELVEIGVLLQFRMLQELGLDLEGEPSARLRPPTVDDGHAGPDVAQRHREVDGFLAELDRRAAPGQPRPVLVAP